MSLPEPAPSPVAVRANPFKGLAYYERQDAGRFAGRQKDIEAVAAGILRTRTFVVYGRSGLGKTSLLLAGALPRLMDQGCRTLDVRLLEDPLGDLRRALARLAGPSSEDTEGTEDVAALVERAGGEHLLVIVFDQFEEFFIRFADQADPAGGLRSGDELDRQARQLRIAQREAFIEEIGRLAADARLNLRLVFSLREDWIAEMGDFADAVPEITQHMYRLLPLTSFGARQAIVETLRSAGTDFDSRLISALVDALADVHFDPVMLQVLGSEVWERARARTSEGEAVRLDLTDLEAIGGVKQVFRGYLDQVQAEIEPADRRRRILTRAVLDALISEKRTKLALSRDDLLQQYFVITEPELDEVLDRLYRHRLIRSDPRGDVRWYELVHERLIGAILEWFETDLDFFKLRSARNLLTSSCRNRGWRENPELLLNRGQLDDTVGPFKDLLRFDEEERLFLVSSAIYAYSRDLEFWAELVGYDTSADLLDRFLDQTDNDRLRQQAAAAAGRVAERPEHFARRCLHLALHDPSAEVRQAAARSFADLASPEEHQALAARLRDRNDRKPALDVLIEVVDKEKLPVGVKLGLFNLRRARRSLYQRRLEAAREVVRERGLRGALIGFKAGLLWSLTAGVLLTRILMYEALPEWGVAKPWAWPLSIGIYLLVALPLGSWTGRHTAHRVATRALRWGREGVTLQDLVRGKTPVFWGAISLIWTMICWAAIATDPHAISELFATEFVGLASGAFVGVMMWMALGVVTGLPALRTEGERSRSSWLWAWLWAFGSSLMVLVLLPVLRAFFEIVEQPSPSSFLVDSGRLLFLVWSIMTLMLGGLFTYAGLLSVAFSLPRNAPRSTQRLGQLPQEPSAGTRRVRQGLGVILAVTSLGVYTYFFGLDGLPFLAHREIVGAGDISREVGGPSLFNTIHLKLMVPVNASSPRLVGVLPEGIQVSTPGWKSFQESSAFILQPGEGRRLALSVGPGRVLIRPDHAFSDISPSTAPQFVVARLSGQGGQGPAGMVDLDRPGEGGRPFYLKLGETVLGGDGCENVGITVSLFKDEKAPETLLGLPCSPRPERVTFANDIQWGPHNKTHRLTVWAWRSDALPRSESRIQGIFSLFWPESDRPLWSSPIRRSNSWQFTDQDRLRNASIQEGIGRLRKIGVKATQIILEHPVSSVAFSPDGTRIATGGFDGMVQIWDLKYLKAPAVTLQHHGAVRMVVFNRDGSLILTVSGDGSARIWNADGSSAPVVLQHPAPVTQAIFSPDGSRVATAGIDGTARLWKLDGSAEPIVLKHEGPVLKLQFLGNDFRLLTVPATGPVRVWDLSHPLSAENTGDLFLFLRVSSRPF